MFANTRENITQPGIELEAIELGRSDQRIEVAALSPPASLPAKSQFLRPNFTGRIALSAALFEISNRPSST